MREIRQSGSEGGVADNGHPYPYRVTLRVGGALEARCRHRAVSFFRYGWIRGRLGILRGWELGSRGGGDL